MEENILRALEFSCHHISPIPFLERFLRLFGFKQDEDDVGMQQIAHLAREYILTMQRSPTYLDFRPSQIAAASIMCAFNISTSSITDSLELTSINEHTLQNIISNSGSSDEKLA